MSATALVLVLLAALLHATWNYCAKRAGGGGLPFVWLVGTLICAGYLPVLVAYCWWQAPALSWIAVAWIAGSGLLKTSYSLFLQRGYRTGDFSLVYPLARGTGPLLSTLAAILLFGERPSPLALAGALVIVASIFWLTGGWSRLAALVSARAPTAAAAPAVVAAIRYGLLSGVFIASYTIWDRHGVATLALAPVLYDGGTSCLQWLLLSPFAARRWPEVREQWRLNRRWAFGVALLSPAAYVLVLTAMKFTPVSYVAPVREVSIVIGAFLGARLLREGEARRRVAAALAMALGVIALALG